MPHPEVICHGSAQNTLLMFRLSNSHTAYKVKGQAMVLSDDRIEIVVLMELTQKD